MDKKSSLGHEWGHSQGQDVESIRGSAHLEGKDKREGDGKIKERKKCPFSEFLVTLVLNRVKKKYQPAAINSQKAPLSRT